MMQYYGYGYGPGFTPESVVLSMFSWVFTILIVVAILGLVRERRESRPLTKLKERYAKGEITKEVFEQTKKDLFA